MGNRMFQNIASQQPINNQAVTQGIQEAQKTQMQATVGGQAGAQLPTNAAAVQQLGAAKAAQAGATAVQGLQQTQQATAQVAGQAQQQQATDDKAKLFQRSQALKQKQAALGLQLGNLGESLKGKLFDQQLDFKKDEMGRSFFNERQLADWKLTQAQSQEELEQFEQQTRQAHAKRTAVLKTAQAKIQQILEQGYIDKEQQLDQNLRRELTQKMAALKKKLAEEAASSSNVASMFGAAGTIVGAVAGSLIPIPGVGTAAGAMIGASVGSGLGQIAGSVATKK